MATSSRPPLDDPTQDVAATDVSRSPKERILGVIQGLTGAQPGSQLDSAIQAHHQQRLDMARRHHREYSLYHSAATSGIDPETGQKLSPEDIAKYSAWAEAAWQDYTKVAGVNPEAKKALERNKSLIDRVTGLFQRHHGVEPGAEAGGLPQPPAAQAQAAAPAAAPVTAGPSELPQPPPATAMDRADVPRLARLQGERQADDRDFRQYTRKEEFLYQQKIKLEEAKWRAKATDAKVMRYSPKIPGPKLPEGSVDVREQPITPERAGPKTVWVTFDGGEHFLEVSADYTFKNVGNRTQMINRRTGEVEMDLGVTNLGSNTDSVDPATGQHTKSSHKPVTAGPQAGLPEPPSATSTTAGTTPPAPPAREPWDAVAFPPVPQAQAGGAAGPSAARSSTSPAAAPKGGQPSSAPLPQLDEAGHIPADYKGDTPQVLEGANELLDGKDLKDIGSAKTRSLSASLARKFGWEQGMFTPLETKQIALATRYINEALESPSLTSLDDDFIAQLPMLGATNNPDKEGIIGKGLTKLASMQLTDDQTEFLRLYRQMAGTISGLSKLSRGGRITEATVNRLLSELPNPTNTKDAADAKARLMRLRDEIQAAIKKGTFEETATGRTGAGVKAGSKAELSQPPSATAKPAPGTKAAAKEDINDLIMGAVAEAKKAKAEAAAKGKP